MATTTEPRAKKPPALLTTRLGTDGKPHHSLPVKESRKLMAAMNLAHSLEAAAGLSELAGAAHIAVAALLDELCPNYKP